MPGLLFAGSGFVAGHAARAGIDGVGGRDPVPLGQLREAVRPTRTGGPRRRKDRSHCVLRTADDARSDLRVGLGEIDLIVDDDVTIDVRAHVHDGEIIVNGVTQPNDGDVQVIRIGPDATAEAVISATVSVGRLEITERNIFDPRRLGD